MAQRVAEMRERRQAARTARRTENRRHSGSLRKNSRTPPGKQAAGKRAARRKHGRRQREPVMPPVAPVLHATAHDGEAKRKSRRNRNQPEPTGEAFPPGASHKATLHRQSGNVPTGFPRCMPRGKNESRTPGIDHISVIDTFTRVNDTQQEQSRKRNLPAMTLVASGPR